MDSRFFRPLKHTENDDLILDFLFEREKRCSGNNFVREEISILEPGESEN